MTFKLRADEGWWQDIPKLIERAVGIYTKLEKDPIHITATKIIEERGWVVNSNLVEPVVRSMGVLYVPKKLFPGPMFLFPEIDTDGKMRAQTKPLHEVFGPGKYFSIGVKKEEFNGPIWLGNDEDTLKNILERKFVVLVEGPFDIIAAKAVVPHIPIMSSLTKTFGKKHEDYLRILGVKTVYLLYDNDEAGKKSMEVLSHFIKTMKIVPLECPASDPSDCLKSRVKKEALQRVLEELEQ